MTPYLWILVLASLAGTRAQDLDLSDFFDAAPTPAKPDAAPTPAKPDKAPPKTADDGFDLSDAFGPDPTKAPKKPAGDPSKTGGTGDFNIFDAVDNDPEKPAGDPKKPVPPKHGGGGGGISDSDLADVAGSDDYKPDAGRGGKGRAVDPSYDTDGQSGDSQELMSTDPFLAVYRRIQLYRTLTNSEEADKCQLHKVVRWPASSALWAWLYLAPPPATLLTRRRNSASRFKEELTQRVV